MQYVWWWVVCGGWCGVCVYHIPSPFHHTHPLSFPPPTPPSHFHHTQAKVAALDETYQGKLLAEMERSQHMVNEKEELNAKYELVRGWG